MIPAPEPEELILILTSLLGLLPPLVGVAASLYLRARAPRAALLAAAAFGLQLFGPLIGNATMWLSRAGSVELIMAFSLISGVLSTLAIVMFVVAAGLDRPSRTRRENE